MGWTNAGGWGGHGWGRAAAGTSYDAATTAWVNAVTTAGGSVSTTQKGRVDTLITSLKSNSIFTLLDRLWLYAGESDVHQAAIDIINLGTHTTHGTITLAAGGYTSDGSTGYLDSGFAPSTAGGNFSRNSALLGFYDRTNTTAAGNGQVQMGLADGGGTCYSYAQLSNSVYDVAGNTFPSFTFSSTQGRWIAWRSDSTHVGLDKNGANVASSAADTSRALVAGNVYVCAFNNGSSASNFCTDQIACAFIGGALDATKRTQLDSAISAYMTAWGV